MKRKLLQLAAILCSFAFLYGCSSSNQAPKSTKAESIKNSRVMKISISSNGKYAVTSNSNGRAYVWNLQDKTYRAVTVKPVNIYSAYFVPNSTNIMIQNDKTNEVYIEDVAGNVLTTFNPGFATYGEAITSDLKTWIASDEKFRLFMRKDDKQKEILYHWCGPDYKNETKPPKGSYFNCSGAMSGQLQNITFTPNEKYFTTTGGGGRLFVWNASTGKSVKIITKNTGPTASAISPDGDYAFTTDSNSKSISYKFNSEKTQPFFSVLPLFTPTQKKYQWRPNTSINFIDDNQYLVTYQGVDNTILYAGLYNTDGIQLKPKGRDYAANFPIKKLPLVKNPNKLGNSEIYPNTGSFLPVVKTSPSTHLLVMAQANGNGIMVYKYDPGTQTLKLVWAPKAKPSRR